MTKTEREEQYEKYETKELAALVRQEAKSRGVPSWDLAMGLSYALFHTDGLTEEVIQYCCVAIYEMRRENGLEGADFDTVH